MKKNTSRKDRFIGITLLLGVAVMLILVHVTSRGQDRSCMEVRQYNFINLT